MRRLQAIGGMAILTLFGFLVIGHFEAGDQITPKVLFVDLLEAFILGFGVLLLVLFGVEALERAKKRSLLMYDDPMARVRNDVWTNRSVVSLSQVSRDIDRQLNAWRLDDIEREVVANVLKGYGDGEIKKFLNLNVSELDRIYRSLSRKTGLPDRCQLAPFFFDALFDTEETTAKDPVNLRVISSQEPL